VTGRERSNPRAVFASRRPVALTPLGEAIPAPAPAPIVDEALARLEQARIDYALAYCTRLKMAGEDSTKSEFQLRTFEAVTALFRANNPGASIDEANAAVGAAIERETAP
jgi:hypothetical protein